MSAILGSRTHFSGSDIAGLLFASSRTIDVSAIALTSKSLPLANLQNIS